MNEWTITGEVVYLKELNDSEFAASAKIRGTASRVDNMSSYILEFPCLFERDVYDDAKKKGLRLYGSFTFSGHFESWTKENRDTKIMHVCDYVMDIK